MFKDYVRALPLLYNVNIWILFRRHFDQCDWKCRENVVFDAGMYAFSECLWLVRAADAGREFH